MTGVNGGGGGAQKTAVARAAEQRWREVQQQVSQEHLAASKANTRDGMMAEGAFAAICGKEEAKAALQKVEVEVTRKRKEEAKAAVALKSEGKSARTEEVNFDSTTMQNVEKLPAAKQQQYNEEKEADVDAQQNEEGVDGAAAAKQRNVNVVAADSVEVAAEAFAAVERQLNSLMEGGEDAQISSKAAVDSDASHCSRYDLNTTLSMVREIVKRCITRCKERHDDD